MIEQKIVFITGAAKRVGAEMTRLLHANNMNVIIHYHASAKEAQSLCDELNQQRQNSAMRIQGDLNDLSNFPDMIDTALNQWGRLDVLINNASTFFPTPCGEISEADWENLLGSNVKGPLFLSQTVAPFLKRNKGCIINIADIHGQKPLKNYLVYSIAKAGLIMLTKGLAMELGPDIRVNAIAPGPVLWPTGKNILLAEKKTKIIDKTCLKRAGSPLDIAKVTYFLIEDGLYITGQVINVDGGRLQ
jgi:pteridine reductase